MKTCFTNMFFLCKKQCKYHNKKIYFLLFIIFLFTIDRLSKHIIIGEFIHASLYVKKITITSFLDFILVQNNGISYGLLANISNNINQWLLGLNCIIVLILFCWFLREKNSCILLSLSLIISGALGNVCDRILYGFVVDFISLHAFGFYWYVFNLADTWITLGGVIIFMSFCFGKNRNVTKC